MIYAYVENSFEILNFPNLKIKDWKFCFEGNLLRFITFLVMSEFIWSNLFKNFHGFEYYDSSWCLKNLTLVWDSVFLDPFNWARIEDFRISFSKSSSCFLLPVIVFLVINIDIEYFSKYPWVWFHYSYTLALWAWVDLSHFINFWFPENFISRNFSIFCLDLTHWVLWSSLRNTKFFFPLFFKKLLRLFPSIFPRQDRNCFLFFFHLWLSQFSKLILCYKIKNIRCQ